MNKQMGFKGKNPWLGLKTYEEGTRLYGRDTEVQVLTDIICNNLTTVVFGRSGIGKSSLIRAGIFPEVRKRGLIPIHIRFEHNCDTSYSHQIEKAVCSVLEKEDRLGPDYPSMGLWDFFHRNVFYDKNHRRCVPVIIIDQFEEIYTLADSQHKHHALELFDELADLLNNIKPEKVLKYEEDSVKFTRSEIAMDTNDMLTFRVRSHERPKYAENSSFHMVICLREDYLYYLERNTSKIPAFKINRFSLQALSRVAAKEIVERPCPGLFNEEEVESIITRISTFNSEGKEEVDPTILSIFLFKYFNSNGNISTDNIIFEFYTDETKYIDDTSLAYLEDHLITTEGYRHAIPYNDALSHGVKKEDIDKLVISRILTVEPRKGHDYLEFSHDVICPVVKSNRERRHLNEQARRFRKRILITTLFLFLAIILVGCFVYMNYLVIRSERSLKLLQIKNVSSMSHYMIVQGDVLNAVKLLLNVNPDMLENNADVVLLPEMERVMNEAYDSLNTDYSCISLFRHSDDIKTVGFSKDSKYIMTSSSDGICRIWNTASAELLYENINNAGTIMSSAMCADGNKLAFSFDKGAIQIIDIVSGKVEHTLKEHTKKVNCLDFSPDKKHIVSSSDDGSVRLWDFETGNLIKTIMEHSDNVNSAMFDKWGSRIITASDDGYSIMYNLDTGASEVLFGNSERIVEYAEFSNDGSRAAIVTGDSVHIINLSTKEVEIAISGHLDFITSVSFSPNDKMIATASHDKTINIWDIAEVEPCLLYTYKGHSSAVNDVVFSPDGKYILSASQDNDARLWNVLVDQKKRISTKMGLLSSATYSFDGKYIAAVSYKGRGAVWSADSGVLVNEFKCPDSSSTAIAFSRNSDKLAVASDNCNIRIYDIASGTFLDSVMVHGVGGFDNVLFVNDDNAVIASSRDGRTLKYWLNDGSCELMFTEKMDSLSVLSMLSGDSLCLLSRKGNETFSLFDMNGMTELRTFCGHSGVVCSVLPSHDNSKIISSSSDNSAIIWNNMESRILFKLNGHSSQVYFSEFSCDDRYALTASTDGAVKVWNVATGKEVATRVSNSSIKYTHAFRPGGKDYMVVDGSEIRMYRLMSPGDLIRDFAERFRNVYFTDREKEYYSLK